MRQERFLYRVSISEYSRNFFLKGGIRIDIGFGDYVAAASELTYSVLMHETGFKIKAYSVESVIAEKFQAMIGLGKINSRIKDLYDIYRK